jgi:hypothetical protein
MTDTVALSLNADFYLRSAFVDQQLRCHHENRAVRN